jgi:2-polyprenyl-3-methyl-5-hydroxy-6-metoxy-1,4-benzoquinol methylase
MPHPHCCLICGNSSNLTPRLRVSRESLIAGWQRTYNIDIADELHDVREVELMGCNHCHLQFFLPPGVAGSPALYAKLAIFNWYYMPDKWEYDAACEDIPSGGAILEIGCGEGHFLEKVRNSLSVNAEGIEVNRTAVESARRRGLNVTCDDLRARAATSRAQYDAVCGFQVLEHMPDPKSFLESCCALLRPGGKLILAVPNANSYLRLLRQLTDMPPHHTTRWSARTLRSLSATFPLRVDRILFEPLALYHVDDFLEPFASLLDRLPIPHQLPRRALRKYVASFLRGSTRIRRLLKGHTLYGCFERC